MIIQNQKVADEKWKNYPTNLFLKIKLQLEGSTILRQVRCFVTCWIKSSIISSESNLTHRIIREKTDVEKKEMYQDRSLIYSRDNDILRR